MKKTKIFSLLGAIIVPTLLIGAMMNGFAHNKASIQAKADIVEKYIPFNATNFTVNTNPEGFNSADDWVTGRFGTFWNHRYFNALDNFYDGFRNEGWTGTVVSKTWTHTGGSVTFTLGGNPMDGENVANKVVIKSGATVIATAHNTAFSDPGLSLNMITKVISIPSEYIDSQLHLEIIDSKTGGFGAVTFGALKVNQTDVEVARTIKTHKVALASIDTGENNAEKNSVAKATTLIAYDNDASYDTFEAITLTNVNEDFEVNGLTNWGYDIDFSQVSTEDTNKYLGVNFSAGISTDTTFWGEQVPFNKEGNAFYSGWAGAPTETARYRFLSAPMTVSGSGIMSVKMGGRTAELQVLDPDDLSILASYQNPSFVDASVAAIITSGARLATMTRIVVDASAYLDQEVIIALADKETGGNWGVAFFDELITDYSSAPSFKLDLLSHAGENGVNKDMFMGPDGSDIKAAYTFLQSYYNALRSSNEDYTYCGLLNSAPTTVQDIVDDYDALSVNVKAIVDGSQDYSYGLVAGDGNFLHNSVDLTNVGTSIQYMKTYLGLGGQGMPNVPSTIRQDGSIIVLFIAMIAFIPLAVYLKKIKRD